MQITRFVHEMQMCVTCATLLHNIANLHHLDTQILQKQTHHYVATESIDHWQIHTTS